MFLSRGEKEHIDKEISKEKIYGAQFSRQRKIYENTMSEVYVKFYANALPLFTTYTIYLQLADTLAKKIASTTGELIHKIGVRFFQMTFHMKI